jgi:chitin disaccharide deacetylase
VTEVFFHPATGRWDEISSDLQSYRLEDELAALVSPEVARALHQPGVQTIAFSDLAAARA